MYTVPTGLGTTIAGAHIYADFDLLRWWVSWKMKGIIRLKEDSCPQASSRIEVL